ncbi:MAG: hypothetical protein KGD58_02935 [Candidatus Lokiarchaeota archaeon]|nr:hypothetical protein [Candidatus Lokiarchaeota archaeon]
MYLVTEQWWPAGKSEEVGKAYQEAVAKFPEDRSLGKPLIPSAVWPSNGKMHSISVSSIKPGKVKEVMDIAYNRELLIAKAVEGWDYEINIAYDAVEAMGLIGLKAPEV